MKKIKKERKLLFPTDGVLIPAEQIPDGAFASGMLGVGFAIVPSAGTVYAPMSGQIDSVADARHAYSLISADGVEMLVHIGIDTVTLKGEGFLSMVAVGDRVSAGDVIARVDLHLLKDRGLSPHIVVLLTDPDSVDELKILPGKGLGGKSEAAVYTPNVQEE